MAGVPLSGGSLEIGNYRDNVVAVDIPKVPPSGGSLEIGNRLRCLSCCRAELAVPPSGGSLEIGNRLCHLRNNTEKAEGSPFGGIPRNWKQGGFRLLPLLLHCSSVSSSPFGGIPRNWKLDGLEYSDLVHRALPLRGDP